MAPVLVPFSFSIKKEPSILGKMMNYTDEKERLLAAIKRKFGVSLTVADDTDKAAVLRALENIADEQRAGRLPAENELLRFFEGKQNAEEAGRTVSALEKALGNMPVALYLICLGTPVDEDVRRILTELCGDEAILIKRSAKEAILLAPATDDGEENNLSDTATAIADTLAADAMTMAIVVVDRTVNRYEEIPKSFENIRKAREIGSRLNPEDRVISFHRLGLGKMLHTLSVREREEFLSDNLGTFRFGGLDPEMQATIRTFFDADLSVSDTAKRLFIHRNTLVYRIDKLYKQTGLDLRRFSDAVIAKIALQLEQLER